MATKKVSPGQTPNRKTAPKIFDVARPGQTVASSTSKPVMITNRPVMQDPMVNEVTSDGLSAPTLPSPSAKKLVIKPLHENIVPEKTAPIKPTIADITPVETTVTVTVNNVTPVPAPAEPEPDTEPETIAFSKTVIGVPTQNPVVSDNTLRPQTGEPASVPTIASVTTEPLIPAGTPNIKNDKQLSPKDADVAVLAAQERAAELQHIIDREQYFLPIKTVEERRSRRIAIIGLLLIIVLGLAWYDTALDAGLITNMYNLPHTHFFTIR